MKKIYLILAANILCSISFAQTTVTKAIFNKTEQPAVSAEYVYGADFTEQILMDDLKEKGFGKGKSAKGYTLFQAINFNEISPDKIDLYIKTEKKSKKEKDKSVCTVLVSKGYDNFMGKETDPIVIQNLMNYLNSLKKKLETGDLDLKIKEQEEQLKKEEKKYNGYLDEQSDLEKKKRKLEEDLINNKKDQEKQKTEVEKQRQVLDILKKQRTV